MVVVLLLLGVVVVEVEAAASVGGGGRSSRNSSSDGSCSNMVVVAVFRLVALYEVIIEVGLRFLTVLFAGTGSACEHNNFVVHEGCPFRACRQCGELDIPDFEQAATKYSSEEVRNCFIFNPPVLHIII
jgi:hypothetical protein